MRDAPPRPTDEVRPHGANRDFQDLLNLPHSFATGSGAKPNLPLAVSPSSEDCLRPRRS